MLNNKYFRVLLLLIVFSILMVNFTTFANTDIFTVMDAPSPSITNKSLNSNIQASYNAHNNKLRNFHHLTASTTITWFQQFNAYSIWGQIVNNCTNNHRKSEKYHFGTRVRHNIDTQHFLFIQSSWLKDRYNSCSSRKTMATGYGCQIFNGPIYALSVEFGPSICFDEYQDNDHSVNILGYAATSYSYQLTSNTKFIQGLSILANDNTILNSETGLNINITNCFSLKIIHKINWSENKLDHVLKNTDIKTSISLAYKT